VQTVGNTIMAVGKAIGSALEFLGVGSAEQLDKNGKPLTAGPSLPEMPVPPRASPTDRLASDMAAAGAEVPLGVASGIKQTQNAAVDAITGMSRAMQTEFKQINQIHSPSRVFREDGRNIGRGLELGLNDTQPAVASAVLGLTGTARGQAPGGSSAAPSRSVTIGDIHIHGVASDASPLEFAQQFRVELTRVFADLAVEAA
jgi:hypothetical protein